MGGGHYWQPISADHLLPASAFSNSLAVVELPSLYHGSLIYKSFKERVQFLVQRGLEYGEAFDEVDLVPEGALKNVKELRRPGAKAIPQGRLGQPFTLGEDVQLYQAYRQACRILVGLERYSLRGRRKFEWWNGRGEGEDTASMAYSVALANGYSHGCIEELGRIAASTSTPSSSIGDPFEPPQAPLPAAAVLAEAAQLDAAGVRPVRGWGLAQPPPVDSPPAMVFYFGNDADIQITDIPEYSRRFQLANGIVALNVVNVIATREAGIELLIRDYERDIPALRQAAAKRTQKGTATILDTFLVTHPPPPSPDPQLAAEAYHFAEAETTDFQPASGTGVGAVKLAQYYLVAHGDLVAVHDLICSVCASHSSRPAFLRALHAYLSHAGLPHLETIHTEDLNEDGTSTLANSYTFTPLPAPQRLLDRLVNLVLPRNDPALNEPETALWSAAVELEIFEPEGVTLLNGESYFVVEEPQVPLIDEPAPPRLPQEVSLLPTSSPFDTSASAIEFPFSITLQKLHGSARPGTPYGMPVHGSLLSAMHYAALGAPPQPLLDDVEIVLHPRRRTYQTRAERLDEADFLETQRELMRQLAADEAADEAAGLRSVAYERELPIGVCGDLEERHLNRALVVEYHTAVVGFLWSFLRFHFPDLPPQRPGSLQFGSIETWTANHNTAQLWLDDLALALPVQNGSPSAKLLSVLAAVVDPSVIGFTPTGFDRPAFTRFFNTHPANFNRSAITVRMGTIVVALARAGGVNVLGPMTGIAKELVRGGHFLMQPKVIEFAFSSDRDGGRLVWPWVADLVKTANAAVDGSSFTLPAALPLSASLAPPVPRDSTWITPTASRLAPLPGSSTAPSEDDFRASCRAWLEDVTNARLLFRLLELTRLLNLSTRVFRAAVRDSLSTMGIISRAAYDVARGKAVEDDHADRQTDDVYETILSWSAGHALTSSEIFSLRRRLRLPQSRPGFNIRGLAEELLECVLNTLGTPGVSREAFLGGELDSVVGWRRHDELFWRRSDQPSVTLESLAVEAEAERMAAVAAQAPAVLEDLQATPSGSKLRQSRIQELLRRVGLKGAGVGNSEKLEQTWARCETQLISLLRSIPADEVPTSAADREAVIGGRVEFLTGYGVGGGRAAAYWFQSGKNLETDPPELTTRPRQKVDFDFHRAVNFYNGCVSEDHAMQRALAASLATIPRSPAPTPPSPSGPMPLSDSADLSDDIDASGGASSGASGERGSEGSGGAGGGTGGSTSSTMMCDK